MNFTKTANEAQVPRIAVCADCEIQQNVLLLYELPAWHRWKKRNRSLRRSTISFFDVRIVVTLLGRRFRPRTPEFGEVRESHVMHELTSENDDASGERLRYRRFPSGFEVDFIIGGHRTASLGSSRT